MCVYNMQPYYVEANDNAIKTEEKLLEGKTEFPV